MKNTKIILLLLAGIALFTSCKGPKFAMETKPGQLEKAVDKIDKEREVDTSWATVPTFNLQFQITGYESQGIDLSDDSTVEPLYEVIDSSLVTMNEIYYPAAQFGRDPNIWFFEPGGYDIYQIRELLLGNSKEREEYERWISERVSDSTMTVFVFPTYNTDEGMLLGFTPVLRNQLWYYEEAAPMYDALFMTYAGLNKGTTLAHEGGHWHTLPHVWELSESEQGDLKLKEVWTHNVMNYGQMLTEIDNSQLVQVHTSATTIRAYAAHTGDTPIYIPPFKSREERLEVLRAEVERDLEQRKRKKLRLRIKNPFKKNQA
jgi:hypothetical protein